MSETDDGWQEFVAQEPDEEDAAWAEQMGTKPDPALSPDAPEEKLEWMASFDGRWRNEFEGLAYLGHLQGDVSIPYHKFTVRTLTTGEKIKIVAMVREFEESIGYARAYRAAVVAAGLVLVDGKPLLVGRRDEPVIEQRYRYVTDNWYDYVVDLLYERINELEGQALEVLKELGIYQTRREVVAVDEAEVAGAAPQE